VIWSLWEQGWAINAIARHGRHTWITVRGVLGAAYEPELHERAARFGLDTELIPMKSTPQGGTRATRACNC
jgi:hypothetical protein